MPLFRNKNVEDPAPMASEPAVGKGSATPKRSERVAQNRRPLVPNDRKEARKQARATMAAQRERARLGFERGEEKYLPVRDRGEVRAYVRDYVDARLSVATFMIPAMIAVIALTFFDRTQVGLIAIVMLWGFLAIAVIDCLIMGQILKRRVTKKFGAGNTRGNTWYASMRAAQLPFMRMPKPRVKLFQFPK